MPPLTRSWIPFWLAFAPLGLLLAPFWPPEIAKKSQSRNNSLKIRKSSPTNHKRTALERVLGSFWLLLRSTWELLASPGCNLGEFCTLLGSTWDAKRPPKPDFAACCLQPASCSLLPAECLPAACRLQPSSCRVLSSSLAESWQKLQNPSENQSNHSEQPNRTNPF